MAQTHDLRPLLFELVIGAREHGNRQTERIAREQLDRQHGITLSFRRQAKKTGESEVAHA